MPQFDFLLDQSWRFLQTSRPASRQGTSLMDIALGRTSIADLAFGRFVQLPSWDEPVPADVERLVIEEVTAEVAATTVAVAQPKLQYASMRVHPT